MRYLLVFVFSVIIFSVVGQGSDIPLNTWLYPSLSSWEIRSKTAFFSTVKPYSRTKLRKWSDSLSINKSQADHFDIQFLKKESWEYNDSIPESKPVLKYLFTHQPDFVSFHKEDFDLHFNPVIYFGLGKDSQSEDFTYVNTRGVELRGTIDDKISFYSLLTENQARYPAYINNVIDSVGVIPYEGFWKRLSDGTGTDFLRARGYIDFAISKHIGAQFGYGKHFVGEGRRSLILSDFANNYPYLRLNTEIWKIQYTNIFAQFVGEVQGGDFGLLGIGAFTKKYFAFHRLGMKLFDGFELGLFESVIYGNADTLQSNGLKLEYLNPIIFYRAIEQQDGSADNVLIGMDFKYNFFKRFQLYGQLVIDELVIKEALSNSGWWGNKQGFQLGAKYVNVLEVDDLNFQVEYNRVRPYVYSHESLFTSYTHYMQPLAHPLGANFKEILLSVNYRPISSIRVESTLLTASYGNDQGSLSYGRDPVKSYNLRPGDFEILQGQGTPFQLFMNKASISYHWKHDAVFGLNHIYRKETNESNNEVNTSSIFVLSFRWNFPDRDYLF